MLEILDALCYGYWMMRCEEYWMLVCEKYWMKNDVDLGSGGCLLELEGKLVVAVMPEFYAKNSLLFVL